MNRWLLLTGCLALLSVGEANPFGEQFAARYDDFKVYRVNIQTEEQFKEFRTLGNHLPLRYLTEHKGPGFKHDIVIDPAHQVQLENQMKFLELDSERVIEDLQSVIEMSQINALGRSKPEMNWEQYQHLDTIYDWLDSISEANSEIITPYTIGYSYEGRPIKAVKISAKAGNKAIFIESNIHAIEWISSATSTCFFNTLLTSQDEQIKNLLENYDWIFVPVLNPDGFEYSHKVNRLWRKNRKPTGFSNSSGICYGVDMNRNFGYEWGASGYNIDVPCDHWYGGAESDSEPEVIALQEFVNSFDSEYIRVYLAVHCFGNWVLLPYGHTTVEFPPNYDQMMRISENFAEGARVKYGTEFLSGASGILNYPVSGSSKDWAYGAKNIPYTATIELRDNGKYGFFLPPNQIKEVCAEFTDGLIALVQQAQAEGLFDKSSETENV